MTSAVKGNETYEGDTELGPYDFDDLELFRGLEELDPELLEGPNDWTPATVQTDEAALCQTDTTPLPGGQSFVQQVNENYEASSPSCSEAASPGVPSAFQDEKPEARKPPPSTPRTIEKHCNMSNNDSTNLNGDISTALDRSILSKPPPSRITDSSSSSSYSDQRENIFPVEQHHATIGDSHGDTLAVQVLRAVREKFQSQEGSNGRRCRSKVKAEKLYEKYWNMFQAEFRRKRSRSVAEATLLVIANSKSAENVDLIDGRSTCVYCYNNPEKPSFRLAHQKRAFISYLTRQVYATVDRALKNYRQKFNELLIQDLSPIPSRQAMFNQFDYFLTTFTKQISEPAFDETMMTTYRQSFIPMLKKQWEALDARPKKIQKKRKQQEEMSSSILNLPRRTSQCPEFRNTVRTVLVTAQQQQQQQQENTTHVSSVAHLPNSTSRSFSDTDSLYSHEEVKEKQKVAPDPPAESSPIASPLYIHGTENVADDPSYNPGKPQDVHEYHNLHDPPEYKDQVVGLTVCPQGVQQQESVARLPDSTSRSFSNTSSLFSRQEVGEKHSQLSSQKHSNLSSSNNSQPTPLVPVAAQVFIGHLASEQPAEDDSSFVLEASNILVEELKTADNSRYSTQSIKKMESSGKPTSQNGKEEHSHLLQDEFDEYKDQNVENMRREVEGKVANAEGIVSAAVTNAIMDQTHVEISELLWGCTENPSGADIEASALCEVTEWLKRNGTADSERKRAFLQDILNKTVTSVWYGVLRAADASRTVHESAAILGLPLARDLPGNTVIISGMRKTTSAGDMQKALQEFGEVECSAVASGRRGFGLLRYTWVSSATRAFNRYTSGEIVILGVSIQLKVLKHLDNRDLFDDCDFESEQDDDKSHGSLKNAFQCAVEAEHPDDEAYGSLVNAFQRVNINGNRKGLSKSEANRLQILRDLFSWRKKSKNAS